MSDSLSQAISNLDKVFDIFNVGRLIFYPAAGGLAIYPLVMIVNLLTLEKESIPSNLLAPNLIIPLQNGNPWLAFFGASLIVGFLVVIVGYTQIIIPSKNQLDKELKDFNLNQSAIKKRITYRYPLLRNNQKEENYHAWLVNEYFRYVEIAIYIPLGFFIGLISFAGYILVFLFSSINIENVTIGDTYNAVLLLLIICAFISFL
ncbi:MAG: hypothetical protein AAGF83_27025, partial [Cyanobacteria bacterium P01_G01_bin.67]